MTTGVPQGAACSQPGYRACRNPAKHMVVPRSWTGAPLGDGAEVPMCGVHKNEHERNRLRGIAEQERRAAEKARQARVGRATNIAMLLTEAIREQSGLSAHFEVSHDGRALEMNVEAAEALRRWLS